jgi:hypothetical protein
VGKRIQNFPYTKRSGAIYRRTFISRLKAIADLPSIEKGEPPELLILDAEPYDDDFSSDAILI